jgi:hypothetical protein
MAADTVFGLVARLNRLLPDDDPHKITRDMVQRIREAADALERTSPQGGLADYWLSLLRADADRIAALLPPQPC